MKNSRLDIFKTFELFNSEAINVLKERVIKFVFIETNNIFESKSCIKADISDENNMSLFVFNNEKLYNVLNSSMHRHQKKMEKSINTTVGHEQ